MKKTIGGIHYDTARDQEIAGGIIDKTGDELYLMKASGGQFYVLRTIQQMYDHGEWKKWDTRSDLIDAGIMTMPDPRTRLIETVHPVTRLDALEWWIKNFVPDDFKPDVLRAGATAADQEQRL